MTPRFFLQSPTVHYSRVILTQGRSISGRVLHADLVASTWEMSTPRESALPYPAVNTDSILEEAASSRSNPNTTVTDNCFSGNVLFIQHPRPKSVVKFRKTLSFVFLYSSHLRAGNVEVQSEKAAAVACTRLELPRSEFPA